MVVTHVDHYSNFLLQQIKEGTIITLTLNNSNIFVSLCVKKRDNELFLHRVTSLTEEEREGEILFEFPTYYHEKNIREYESFFRKEVKVLQHGNVSHRVLLIWIGQSFLYRYRTKKRNSFSVCMTNTLPSFKAIVHYWMYYIYISLRRRQR